MPPCCRSISTRCAPRPASSRSSPPPTSPARTMSARSSTTTGCSPTARSSIPASRSSSSPRPAPAPPAAPPGSARPWSSRAPPSSRSPTRRPPAPRSKRPQIMARGDADAALAAAPHRLTGTLEMGGQEHFYLEGQAALATPGRAGPAPHPQLHPASERDPASGRQAARPQPCRRHRRGPPHGRRVRRQGDPGRRLRRRLRAGRGEDRPPRQVPRRPRRRHGARPASATISPSDYDVGFDGEGRIDGIRIDPRLALRRHRRPLAGDQRPRDVPRRQLLLSCPRSRSSRTGSRPTPSPTPPSAASAGRRG